MAGGFEVRGADVALSDNDRACEERAWQLDRRREVRRG